MTYAEWIAFQVTLRRSLDELDKKVAGVAEGQTEEQKTSRGRIRGYFRRSSR